MTLYGRMGDQFSRCAAWRQFYCSEAQQKKGRGHGKMEWIREQTKPRNDQSEKVTNGQSAFNKLGVIHTWQSMNNQQF